MGLHNNSQPTIELQQKEGRVSIRSVYSCARNGAITMLGCVMPASLCQLPHRHRLPPQETPGTMRELAGEPYAMWYGASLVGDRKSLIHNRLSVPVHLDMDITAASHLRFRSRRTQTITVQRRTARSRIGRCRHLSSISSPHSTWTGNDRPMRSNSRIAPALSL